MSDHVGGTRESEDDVVLIGGRGDIRAMPGADFRQAVRGIPVRSAHRRAFMTEVHVRVREHVVREMGADAPLRQESIAATLGLPVPLVVDVLDDLERHLFFVVRAEDGTVTWAFPVTTEPTRHRLRFPGGDLIYAA